MVAGNNACQKDLRSLGIGSLKKLKLKNQHKVEFCKSRDWFLPIKIIHFLVRYCKICL